jgi:hypothetical protein
MRKVLLLASAVLCLSGLAFAQQAPTPPATPQQPQPGVTSFRGCLTAGGDQFKLTTDIGARVLNLDVDKNAATPFIAHEVEVQGTATAEGALQVQRILDIADHCGHAGETPVMDMSTITPKHP